MSNYTLVRSYVVKAEAALESMISASSGHSKTAPSSNMPGMIAPAANAADTAKDKERIVMMERLTVAGGIAHLGMGSYDQAARAFTSVGRETLLGTIPHVRAMC